MIPRGSDWVPKSMVVSCFKCGKDFERRRAWKKDVNGNKYLSWQTGKRLICLECVNAHKVELAERLMQSGTVQP